MGPVEKSGSNVANNVSKILAASEINAETGDDASRIPEEVMSNVGNRQSPPPGQKPANSLIYHSLHPEQIFSNYQGFYLVPSSTFDAASREDIQDLIVKNGSVVISGDNDNTPPPDSLTSGITVIADNIDFPEYETLCDQLVSVITPQWVRDSVAQGKPLPYRPYSPDPHLFFSGIMVCAAGLSQGDREAIYAGVTAYGGLYDNRLTKFTTHIITTNINEEKCQRVLQMDLPHKLKIVLPHWIDDCLKLGRRVDESLYLFPNPSVLAASGDDVDSLPKPSPSSDPSIGPFFKSDLTVAKSSNIFAGKRFYIAEDFGLSASILTMIHEMIANCEGTIVTTVQEANVYVGKYRYGEAYIQASRRSSCTVGNLDWVYWMVSHHKWNSPLRMLLHYPLGRDGVPGMKNCLISLTNFTGPARRFIERLIVASGASYSSSLKMECTHLITARPSGRKYEAAREWNIHVVNHLWLEESYSLWEMQSVAILRYIHFPPLLDLTSLVGQTRLKMKHIRKFFAPQHELEPVMRTPRAASEKAKQAVHESMAKETEYLEKLKSKRKHLPPLAEEIESQPKKKRVVGADESKESGGEHEKGSDQNESKNGDKHSPNQTKHTINDIEQVAREQNVVPTSSPATRNIAPDSPVQEPTVVQSNGSRNAEVSTPPSRLNVILTSVADQDQPSTAKTEEVSIFQVTDPLKADYIISPRVVRTEKFLSALATAKAVLKPDYLSACISTKSLLWPIPTKYILGNKDLQAALVRSAKLREKNKGLFEGYSFNVTPDINGGVDTFNRVVMAHGASSSRVISSSKIRNFNQSVNDRAILITAEKNEKIAKGFKEMVGSDVKPYVFTSDWVYQSILNMSIDFKKSTYAL
ncbi:Rtt107p [Sugiyamaella lignohabitans]|uniref:Rtt107p n=1 Tax=Sugiyamaella lignohabitans TaxID=796027 RepID=A0A170R019_9ASCO|nr:Rtt107p [Sugiyamaella lignohabitans]ANB16031.1 Rtt107p [Sugiyamaella lignohabitans]